MSQRLLLLPLLACAALAGCASAPETPPSTPATTTTTQTTTTSTTVVQPAVTPPPASTAAATKTDPADPGSNDPAMERRLRAQITNAARKPHDKLLVCYRDAIRRDKKTSGTVSINFTVAPSGEPVVIDDAGSTVKDADFVTCVRSVLSKASYPRWKGKAVTVVVNYDFTREVADPPVPED